MCAIERDAFTSANGYPDGIVIDGIPMRDRAWLDMEITGRSAAAPTHAPGCPCESARHSTARGRRPAAPPDRHA